MTDLIIEVHCTRDVYRYVGPHGPSIDYNSKRETLAMAKWAYGSIAIVDTRLADWR
jgi:hypothetical protein